MTASRHVFLGIGIAKPKGMVVLPGVYEAIEGYLLWAKSQKYEILSITDEASPVPASKIRILLGKAFKRPVSRLVIAFVGHGFQDSIDQIWILSDGPDVNSGRMSRNALRGSLRTYGPQQISIIGDACRESRNFESGVVTVIDDLPNPPKKVYLDLFSSTLANQAAFAFRAKPNQAAYCLFSAVMLDFLCGRDPRAFRLATGESGDVTTQTLYNSLPDALLERGAALGVDQEADISPGFKYGEDIYSRRSLLPPGVASPFNPTTPLSGKAPSKKPPSKSGSAGVFGRTTGINGVSDRDELFKKLPLSKTPDRENQAIDAQTSLQRVLPSCAQLASNLEFDPTKQPAILQEILNRFLLEAKKYNEKIAAVVHQSGSTPGWGYIINEAPTGHIVSPVQLTSGAYWSPITWSDLDEVIPYIGRRASQMLTLSWHSEKHEEFFAMIPLFEHHIAQVHFGGDDKHTGGVSAVSWFPDYGINESLPALTLAAQQALFLLEKGQLRARHAHEIASQLRVAKHADPLLGMVCAYLYDLAGDLDSINRMCHFYVKHKQRIPFDIAMLAGDKISRDSKSRGLVASFPKTEVDRAASSNPALANLPYLWESTPAGEGLIAGVAPLLRVGWTRIGARPDLKWARRLFNVADALAASPIATLVGRRGKIAALETLEEFGVFEKRLYDWRP